MELVHEFDFYATLTVLSGGGDWIVMGSDGWGQIGLRVYRLS